MRTEKADVEREDRTEDERTDAREDARSDAWTDAGADAGTGFETGARAAFRSAAGAACGAVECSGCRVVPRDNGGTDCGSARGGLDKAPFIVTARRPEVAVAVSGASRA